MAYSLCGGDLSTLAGKVNSFFESVSRYLVPLDAGMVPLDCPVPMHYIVNSETVSKFLSEINKDICPDGILSWLLRDHALTLAKRNCTIFNESVREGYLPAICRSAIVIPIPKVNPLRIISKDLRPISLTAVLSKQLEKIIGRWMLNYIVNRSAVNQYGGLRGLSTSHALVYMVHTWLLTAEEKKAPHVVLWTTVKLSITWITQC